MAVIVPVLLAGGLGTRLWPLSREVYPKQLMNLTGRGSLLQQAARRAMLAAPAGNLIAVTTETHYFPVRDQLTEIDQAMAGHILLEPAGRNTAAAVAIAAHHALGMDPEAILFVSPADHVILNERKIAAAVGLAAGAADQGRLVTFGIQPTRPETGYGYIMLGDQTDADRDIFPVSKFVEKPDSHTAAQLIAGGNVLWNSGMFVFRADKLLGELETHAPDIATQVAAAHATAKAESGAVRFEADMYGAIPALPIDKAVMERSSEVAVIPTDPGWSDVGSWQKLWDVSERDENDNAVTGDVVTAETRNCMIRGESRLVACAGLENMVITETADAILVAAMGADEAIKSIVDTLRAAKRQEAVRHTAENRPWGSFQTLLEGPGFKIKEIIVKPSGILSLQKHHYRSEHWVVVEGTAKATCDTHVVTLKPNESTFIPVGSKHRLENPGTAPLRIIEVQCGSYVGEDDIVRFEDSYGRAAPA